MKKSRMKNCHECGKQFFAVHYNKMYCDNKECEKIRYKKQIQKQQIYSAKRLEKKRLENQKPHIQICQHCGQEFKSQRKRKFCDDEYCYKHRDKVKKRKKYADEFKHKKVCQVCGDEFPTSHLSTEIYCDKFDCQKYRSKKIKPLPQQKEKIAPLCLQRLTVNQILRAIENDRIQYL